MTDQTTNAPDPAAPIPPRLHLGRLLLERDNMVKHLRDIPSGPEAAEVCKKVERLNERIDLIEDIAAGIGLGLIWHEDNKGK